MDKRGTAFKVLLAVAAIWFYVFHGWHNKGFLPVQVLMASLVYLVTCIPTVIYFARSEKTIPYVPLYGIIYFMHFGNIFSSKDVQFWFDFVGPATSTTTLLMVLVGFVAFLMAFYSQLGKPLDSALPHLDISLDPSKSSSLGLILYFVSITITYFFSNYTLSLVGGSIHGFIVQLSLLAIIIFFLLGLQGKLSGFFKLLLWVLFIPSRLLYTIATGSVMPVLLESCTLFFIYFYCRQKIPWVALIIVSLFIFRVWGVRDEYRSLAWYGGRYSAESTIRKIVLYLELMVKLPGSDSEFDAKAYEKLVSRSNHLVTFVRVVDLTPRTIPYWNGHTYRTLPLSFFPRALFPGKPTKNVGTEFGHRYCFLLPSDMSTSYNLPITLEMFVNFGPWGVVVGMFIFGLIIRGLYAMINFPGCKDGTFLIGAAVFYNLLNVESDFSLVFGNVIQYMILFYMVMSFMSASSRRIQEQAGQ